MFLVSMEEYSGFAAFIAIISLLMVGVVEFGCLDGADAWVKSCSPVPRTRLCGSVMGGGGGACSAVSCIWVIEGFFI